MTRLSSNDYDLLLQCVGELHSFRTRSALCGWLLDQALPMLVPSDWLSYNEVDLLAPDKTIAVLKPESNTFFRQLFPRFKELAWQHPLIVNQMQSANFPVHKISDFLTQDAFHQLELYQDVYRLMGVEYQIAVTVRLSSSHVIAFALSRKDADYDERERALLELLRPHLVVAFNNLDLIQNHKTIQNGTELALNELSSATLIVEPQGNILYHTGPAMQWLGVTSTERVPAPVTDWLNRCLKAGNREALRWNSTAGEIQIRAMPTSASDRWLLVLSLEDSRRPAGGASGISGLSRRQQEVAHWIREGKTNPEIATIMGISPRTVQKHVEHIFEKLGVESRVAIATLQS
ncbi:MAG TPA: LuxR C-terminal-related transcriptional regulator [Pseudomonadales bacterium]|nr:LuxR C-terminal-related transcriptional regulator [Pseudomonadales bacterium]